MSYVKLFGSILDSTVWRTPPAITKVWIALLAMKDQNGEVMASVPGLADRAKVSRRVCERALRIFLAPDRDSRTKDDDGRRIREIDGGWLVLNHDKYALKDSLDDRRRKDAERQRRRRERLAGGEERHVTSRDSHARHAIRSDQSTADDPDQKGFAPPVRAGAGPRPGRANGHDRVASTDAKLAEMRAAADRAATPEELEALRRERTGGAA